MKPLRVLLVEDDDCDAKLTKRAFKHALVILRRVASGEDAIDTLRDKSMPLPDIVLLDMSLPGIQGLEVASRIKKDHRTCHLPVVMLTSSRSQTEVLESWKNSIAGYLHKPVTSEAFREVAATTIDWLLVNELHRG